MQVSEGILEPILHEYQGINVYWRKTVGLDPTEKALEMNEYIKWKIMEKFSQLWSQDNSEKATF